MKRFWAWFFGIPGEVDELRLRVNRLENEMGQQFRQLLIFKEDIERLKTPIERKPVTPQPQTWRQTLAMHERYNAQQEDTHARGL